MSTGAPGRVRVLRTHVPARHPATGAGFLVPTLHNEHHFIHPQGTEPVLTRYQGLEPASRPRRIADPDRLRYRRPGPAPQLATRPGRPVLAVLRACTNPGRLARWYGQVEGDLGPGGEFRARVLASGWDGTGRVDACEPRRRLLVASKEADAPDEEVIEATLTADAGQTILILDQRLPMDQLAAYGAGLQIHVEDLAAHSAGRERVAQARWSELLPAYQDLAANIG
jgi:uncharacterized protein YndB with AHSA1/START domain